MHAQKTISALPRPKRVVVMTNRMTVDCQDRLRGIERFLETEVGWAAHFVVKAGDMTGEVVREESRRGADGFIVDISVGTDVLDALVGLRVPVMTIDVRGHAICEGRRNVRTVCCDDEGVARAAVTHFLDQERFHSWRHRRALGTDSGTDVHAHVGGPRHLLPRVRAVAERARAEVARAVAEKAAEARRRDGRERRHGRARRAGRRGRAPAHPAVRRRAGVRQRRARLPEQYAHPFQHPAGFRGRGFPRGADPRRAHAPIAVRESTAPVSQAGFLIRRAQQFIDKNACKGIGVDDVARHLGISRRLLYLRFREIKGIAPFEAIRDRRLEAVRHRLLTTHETIAAIAADCGFESETHLMHLFKRRFGLTMRAFRRRTRS